MATLSAMDMAWLYNESRDTPMHVGCLALFKYPKGIDKVEFLDTLEQTLGTAETFSKPFGHILKRTLSGYTLTEDIHLDPKYHVRRTGLARPGRYREMFDLISRLHSVPLDRTRPLWEIHLIDGMENDEFAFYMKTHHAVFDGAKGMHLLNSMTSEDANDTLQDSPFSEAAQEQYRKRINSKNTEAYDGNEMKTALQAIRSQLGSSINISKTVLQSASALLNKQSPLHAPWKQVPKTIINGKLTGARRFVAQSWDFDRIRAIGKAFGGTFNDAVLAMCAGAIRKYLIDMGELPERSLKVMAPVSIRAKDDLKSGNAVAAITADLATDVGDPAQRIKKIMESMRAGKEQLSPLSNKEASIYMMLAGAPVFLTSMLGIANSYPAQNIGISNVPGPRQTRYLNGAEMRGMYPVSIPMNGMGMNITVVTRGNQADFGITACRSSVPHAQRLISYMDDALLELEGAIS